MLIRGIFSIEQYLDLPEPRWLEGPRVAYSLLDLGDQPGPDRVRLFEDISLTLRTSGGPFRTTFRNRFPEVDAAALSWLRKFFPADAPLVVQDRAASHGLTAAEWAGQLFPLFPRLDMEASDVMLELLHLRLDDGAAYITDADGIALQLIRPPFVIPLTGVGIAARHPVNRWLAGRAKRRYGRLGLPAGWMNTEEGAGYRVRRIPYIHPETRALMRHYPEQFRFRRRSVFDCTPGACDVIRTMNILNRSYLSPGQMQQACVAVRDSLRPGGIWIAGRTSEEDRTNHASILRRAGEGWQVLERIGEGAEIEGLAVGPE